MKPPIYLFLLLVLISRCAYAQVPHTLTIPDLQQLADCPDQFCLGSRVNQEGYTYKGPQKGKNNGFAGTQYRYNRPHSNPMFTEFTASYWVMNDDSRRVSFTSDNKVWIAGLKSTIGQSGFTFVRQKGLFGDKEFVRSDRGRTWHLNWAEPRLLVDAEPHTLTVYSDTQPAPSTNTATLPAQPSTIASQSTDPHLGGHWDADYPVLDAAQLLQAERRYAADYERSHGKTGNTFSRCEKVRIRAMSRGQYRPLTTERWDKSFDHALRHTGFDAFADNRTKLYKQELLVDMAGESLWMPIQEIVIKTLETEAKAGEMITLYAVLVSHHDFDGTLHLSFLINEFAAASTTDSFDAKPEATQATTELAQPPLPVKSVIAVPPKATGTVKTAQPEDFNAFIQRFSADPAFQLNRVKFPIKREGYYDNVEKPEIKFIQRSVWRHIDYSKPSPISDGQKGVGNWTPGEDKNSDKKSLGACGCEKCACGYFMSHNFQRIAGKWYLTKEIVVSN